MSSTPGDDKASASHVDNISPRVDSDPVVSHQHGDEEIVEVLQHTGEEVGMTWRTIAAAISMGTSYNAYLLTLLAPPAILSFINAELGPEPTYTWITISWNLGGAILVTIGGRLSDIFGRRWFFLGGTFTLVIGAIVGVTGRSINQMIASGAINGAASGLLETSYGAVQEIVPNEYRMATVGMFDFGGLIAQLSPLMAWAMIKYTGNWRNVYYLMLGCAIFNLVYLYFFYHPPAFATKHSTDGRTRWDLFKSFDWLGLFIFVSGCTLFLVGVNWGGVLYPWVSAPVIAPIVIGAVLLVGLGFYEAYANIPEPLLPPRLFKQVRQFTVPMIVMSVVGMQYYSNAVLWPRLSQLLFATDEISKGLYSEVVPLGSVVGGLLICFFSKKIGHQKWQVVFAIALQTSCVGALSTTTIDNPAKSVVLTFFVSLTVTIVMLNCFVLVGFGIVNQDDIGTAAGLAGTARLIFGAVATAIFGNVTNNKYAESLRPRVAEAVFGLGFTSENLAKLAAAAKAGTPAAYSAVPGITPEIQAAATVANKLAYLDGAKLSYQIALAFGLLGCIAALWITSIDSRKYTKKTVALQESDRKALREKESAGSGP